MQMDDDLIFVIAKEAVYKKLDKMRLDSTKFMASMFIQLGTYGTFSGRIWELTEKYGPLDVGTYNVLITPGEFFPEAGEAQVDLPRYQTKEVVTR